MTVKIIQLLAVLYCLWLYIDLRRKLHAKFITRHEHIRQQLIVADRYNNVESIRLGERINSLCSMAYTKKQKRLAEEHRQLWKAKFDHLYK